MNEFDKKCKQILQNSINDNIIDESKLGDILNSVKNVGTWMKHPFSSTNFRKERRDNIIKRFEEAIIKHAGFSKSEKTPFRYNGTTTDNVKISVIFEINARRISIYENDGSGEKIGEDKFDVNTSVDSFETIINDILAEAGYEDIDFVDGSKKNEKSSIDVENGGKNSVKDTGEGNSKTTKSSGDDPDSEEQTEDDDEEEAGEDEFIDKELFLN